MSGAAASYKAAVRAVTAILAQRDPIGIGGSAGSIPASEYESEAREIVRRAFGADQLTVLDVERIVSAVLSEAFSEDFDPNEVALLGSEIRSAVGQS